MRCTCFPGLPPSCILHRLCLTFILSQLEARSLRSGAGRAAFCWGRTPRRADSCLLRRHTVSPLCSLMASSPPLIRTPVILG